MLLRIALEIQPLVLPIAFYLRLLFVVQHQGIVIVMIIAMDPVWVAQIPSCLILKSVVMRLEIAMFKRHVLE